MKLKSLIAFAGVACAAVSYGETTSVETGNTLCRIKFTTSEKEVLIGLPLVDVGGTTQTINATNYIMAATLTEGDALLGKVGGSWGSWKVSSGAWISEAIVEDDVTKYSAAADASFTRGGAVRLSFKNDSGEHTVYLYGQVANASTTGTAATTASRNSEKATYTLLSNINASSVEIGSLNISNKVVGDKIAVLATGGIGQTEYTWNGSNWVQNSGSVSEASPTNPIFPGLSIGSGTTSTVANKTFAPGEGFFYITAKGDTDKPATFTWGN